MSDSPVFAAEDVDRAGRLLDDCKARGWMLTTAESCTGGLIAALLTEVAGSSAVFDRGFVTYSNEAKIALLGVHPGTLAAFGAVSPETAGEMARGAIAGSVASWAVSVTGVAGPGGGTASKPVGLVHFALAGRDGATTLVERRFTEPGRAAVRLAALRQALRLFESAVQQDGAGDQAMP